MSEFTCPKCGTCCTPRGHPQKPGFLRCAICNTVFTSDFQMVMSTVDVVEAEESNESESGGE